MQRIIPFGRDYAQSAEFSVDEGQTIRFWAVREDYTTTPGHHTFAELQLKSASGNDHWTTVGEINGDKPYYDLEGVDENLVYRWVRKPVDPPVALDRSQDGAYSRQQRAPVNLSQPNFNDPDDPVVFKALAATLGDLTGVRYDFQLDGVDSFGNLVSTLPALTPEPTADSYIHAYYDADNQNLVFEFFEDLGGGTSNVDWSEYIGGQVGIASECLAFSPGVMTSTSWAIAAEDVTANGFTLTVADPSAQFAPLEGTTFFVFLMKPGQAYPTFNLGARTGRFTLDRNDAPARLSAGPFDTDNERVALSVVEGSVVIPWLEGGDQLQLDRVDYSARTIEAPGEYEWERSCNASPGVWLNTGWRA